MSSASDSPQGRQPYATLLRCPTVVLQRSAKSARSAGDMLVKNSLNSMPNYHHTVIGYATPVGEFTKWCSSADNKRMTREEKAQIRRENLRRFVDRHLDENLSELARLYARHMGKRDPRPNFFSDLLRAEKGFAETLAEAIEAAVRLKPGQLSIPDSPLEMREPLPKQPSEIIHAELEGLEADEVSEVLALVQEIKGRRRSRRRASR
jgi:hypothetical protein